MEEQKFHDKPTFLQAVRKAYPMGFILKPDEFSVSKVFKPTSGITYQSVDNKDKISLWLGVGYKWVLRCEFSRISGVWMTKVFETFEEGLELLSEIVQQEIVWYTLEKNAYKAASV